VNQHPGQFRLLTVSGEYVDLPRVPEDAASRDYFLALVRCRMRWMTADELRRGPPPADAEAGAFPDAATLCVFDNDGEPLAVPAPYDCGEQLFVFGISSDGMPEWRPVAQTRNHTELGEGETS
jgi:hypothetical protein